MKDCVCTQCLPEWGKAEPEDVASLLKWYEMVPSYQNRRCWYSLVIVTLVPLGKSFLFLPKVTAGVSSECGDFVDELVAGLLSQV